MTRVLVTGAGGYIGRHVVRALSAAGAEVVAVDRAGGSSELPAGVTTTQRDIFSETDELLDEVGPVDVCLHLAWEAGFVHDSPVHMLRLSDHVRFLDAVAARGTERLTVLGSMHEVGYHEGAITEDTPTNPRSQYGIAKDALRRSLTLRHASGPTTLQWLRCFYVMGDDARSASVFGKILAAAAEGRTTFPFTSGRNRYDFIDVAELGHQIAAAALQSEVTGVINCCSGEPVSLGERVERFIADNGLDIRLEYGVYPDRAYDSPGVWGDPTKIRQILAAERPSA
ncbi:NAD(P)-dependent oxidoreductase [Cellulomonas sp. zg-ZUI199]|uniref:NAD(P)-dependent oxidoreductase n=1 Tax=Cellulomonas wangleii TaxID=2816956 RepID=A0ABX8D3J6_9CELL|nr:NAD(P)-dependent oxidoreductase [Cellulomonas wangleii]MBO0923722.1 NAD(P)-dependent oxidoreductase [Cellulomonas wangleii]MBO0924004.1 NAD(P)-dependent oxidoreductase [Cellulomonas wangleii]QVI62033.1 NAD(P)-dependent oxidoreductase [Cellulomonas wangleii]